MNLKYLFSAFILLCCHWMEAQDQTIQQLDEVVISDVYLKNNNKSQTVQVLNDSIIRKNQSSLTDLLNHNTAIYFKEQGRGMLSTVSFRGTTASQTAVIWNGININSQFNGSTDFNTITSNDFNSVSVKAGGGSVIYGSGAIGGSVHLNNELVFKKQIANDLKLAYGSFGTVATNYKIAVSDKKWSLQTGFSYNGSENDYPYVGLYTWKGEQRKNLNGQFSKWSLNANAGYKFDERNSIRIYSQTSQTDRHLSLISESDGKTKYLNSFSRNLLEYRGGFGRLLANVKTAFITEDYKYFEDISSDFFTYGKSESFISKLDLGYSWDDFLDVNAIFDYNHTKGAGSSFGNSIRQIGSAGIFARLHTSTKWQNEFTIRKEITNNYQSPVLFSAGSTYCFSKFYNLKANVSRNFRIPTFNDLYWEPGGNRNLKPESSYQAEVGNVFSFKKITLTQNFYFNKIKDMIRWLPTADNPAIWSPQNTDRVMTYGTETLLGWKNNYGKHFWAINGTYAYTISENEETHKQLFYVPFHKMTTSVAYAYGKFSANYQFLFNGFVYTRSDNDPNEILDAYNISNIGIDYAFFKSSRLGFQVLNLFNEKYEMQEDRPMPGRNFNMYLTIKF